MTRSRKEKKTGHGFYSTDFQFQLMTEYANVCGLTFSQLIQKIAKCIEDKKDRVRLMKLLKLSKAMAYEPEILKLQRQARATGLTQELKDRLEELKYKNELFWKGFHIFAEQPVGYDEYYDDYYVEDEDGNRYYERDYFFDDEKED